MFALVSVSVWITGAGVIGTDGEVDVARSVLARIGHTWIVRDSCKDNNLVID